VASSSSPTCCASQVSWHYSARASIAASWCRRTRVEVVEQSKRNMEEFLRILIPEWVACKIKFSSFVGRSIVSINDLTIMLFIIFRKK
jgi:hypothetical protein